MANTKPARGNDWPTQKYNKIIDDDPQIVRVPLENVDFGSRPSVMPKGNRNIGKIEHVKSKG